MERKNQKTEIFRKNKGFTLVELLVAIFVFSLMITVSISAFSSVIISRKNTRITQKNVEEARTAIETMAKNIRMSTNLGPGGSSRTSIYMYNNSQEMCVAYRFSSNRLQTNFYANAGSEEDPDCDSPSGWINIINTNAVGKFYVVESDDTTDDEAIGRATIHLTIGSGNLEKHMQTTVSFRDYGVLPSAAPVVTEP